MSVPRAKPRVQALPDFQSACDQDRADAASTIMTGQPADFEPGFGQDSGEPLTPMTERQIAEIEQQSRETKDHWERVYDGLRLDAQSCMRSMRSLPVSETDQDWPDVVSHSLENYRSGRSLMDHLGADRLIDPALTGMLLAMRRGLIEEIHAPTMADFMLIDMAVIAFSNAMRMQSVVGNNALLIESELFGQPTLRKRWSKEFGGEIKIGGLSVDEHVVRLRETLMPLTERFNRMGGEAINALRKQRETASMAVERSRPIQIKLSPVVTSDDCVDGNNEAH